MRGRDCIAAAAAFVGLLQVQPAQADFGSLAGVEMGDPFDAQHKIVPINQAYQATFTRNVATARADQSVHGAISTAQGSVIVTGSVHGNIYNAPIIGNTGSRR